jgi:hypothetical protein
MAVKTFNEELGEGLRNNSFDISLGGLIDVMNKLNYPIDYSLIDRAMMLCKTVPIPASETELIDVEHNGLVYSKAGKQNHGEISLGFYNSSNQIAHDMFVALHEAQSYYNAEGKLITNTYPFSFKLIQYDTNGNPIAGWKIIDAVLSSVSNPEFDRGNTSSMQEFTISLKPLMTKKIPLGELGNVLEEAYAWYNSISDLSSGNFSQVFGQ